MRSRTDVLSSTVTGPARLGGIGMVAVWAFLLPAALSVRAGEDHPLDPRAIKFFEKNVRPLLAERCFKCHGEKEQKGKLRLDSRASMVRGGESGEAIVPGDPGNSLLVEAINYESYEMPPDGKLSDEQIGVLTKWIEMGAPWPGAKDVPAPVRPAVAKISEEDRQFWSFQPLHDPQLPAVSREAWCRNPIDRFVLAKLDEQGLSPAPEASPISLVRRLYQDLIGLPPTPEQVDQFLSDSSPQAYERLVDDLLNSPRYGEHQARFWLDLVRYADSDGYKQDAYRPQAWRYRDYVIRAYNEDKPYDQFIAEQLAGDEIAPDDPEAIVATGFLRHGIYEYNQRDALTQWQDMLNDITDTTADVFLGLGMGCARCHDHKFDPILQRDYFRLQAFFANIELEDNAPLVSAEKQTAYEQQLAKWETATAEVRREIAEIEAPILKRLRDDAVTKFSEEIQAIVNKPEHEKTSYDRQITHLVDLQVIDAQNGLKVGKEDRERYEALQKQLAEFDHLKPESLPTGRTICDYGRKAPEIFIPGKERLGAVPPGFLTLFEPEPATIEPLPEVPDSSGRRTTLANWLTRPDHPLTSRVMVNRIWQQHFGRGIVATPSDFGHLGEAPSHPKLLDWLAIRFVESGWSVKTIHRLIVTSAAYRQSALHQDERAQTIDPQNRLLWRANVRRLDAEQIRDAMLAVSGELDESPLGGPGLDADSACCRSIYCKVFRNDRPEVLEAFDFPDRIRSIGERNVTVSPNQSLLLINGDWTLERARAFAARLPDEGALDSQIREAVRLALGRDAGPEELNLLSRYAERTDRESPGEASFSPSPLGEGTVLQVSEAQNQSPLQSAEVAQLGTGDFTIEAVVLLNSLYQDASVRTIASQWTGNTKQSGWSLGVTSQKSAHKPANVILQLVGETADGPRAYEVVASGIHLQLSRPYRISVAVRLQEMAETGIDFRIEDLKSGDVQTAHAEHSVVRQAGDGQPLVIGGRAASKRHRWDGLIDNIRLRRGTAEGASDLAHWSFDGPNDAQRLQDALAGELLHRHGEPSDTPHPALVDICHVLLNSNEFLYLD